MGASKGLFRVGVLGIAFLAMSSTSGPPAQARTAKSAQATTSKKGPRVLVYYDMEGVAGQSDWRTAAFPEKEYYPQGQELLIADVNEVVAGLADAGATVIDVVDMHGSGSPDPDMPPDRLDPRARAVFRDSPFDPVTDLVKPGVYDAVAAVAMHAKTSTRKGFLAHTWDVGFDISLNGHWVTETEFIGYSWGRVGVPVIFVSGDDQLANDLKTMPWIEYVTVKHATGAISADLLSVDQVHQAMRRGARKAIEHRAQARTMRIRTPIHIIVRASPPASLASLDGVPGVKYKNQSVSWTAADFLNACRGIWALDDLATKDFDQFTLDQIKSLPSFAELARSALEAKVARYAEAQAGRWTSPPPAKPLAARDGKYYGHQ